MIDDPIPSKGGRWKSIAQSCEWNGITTLGELAQVPLSKFYEFRMPNCGPAAVAQIIDLLDSHGIEHRMSPTTDAERAWMLGTTVEMLVWMRERKMLG